MAKGAACQTSLHLPYFRDLFMELILRLNTIINKHHGVETISSNMQMFHFSLSCHLEAIHNTPKLSFRHTTETQSPREGPALMNLPFESLKTASQEATTASLDTATSHLRVALPYLLLFALAQYISETPSAFKLSCTVLHLLSIFVGKSTHFSSTKGSQAQHQKHYSKPFLPPVWSTAGSN